jgi:AcrR family transcriptional regulator
MGTVDLTARARIRNAALAEFAEHGIRGAGLRRIAERAEVSLALVQYHFTNKEGLRRACDEYVLEFGRAMFQQGVEDERLADPEFIEETYRASEPVLAYLARILAEANPAADPLFASLVAQAEAHLAGSPDPHTDAAVFVAMRLGPFILHRQLSRALGANVLRESGMRRVDAALMRIVAPEILGADLRDRAREGLREEDGPESRRRADPDSTEHH